MNLLTAHEGRMPSPDKSPSKSHLVPGTQEAILLQPDEISFDDTFAGLPAQAQTEDITNQNLLTSPENISGEILHTESIDPVLLVFSEDVVELDIDIVDVSLKDVETDLIEVSLTNVTTQKHPSEITRMLDVAISPFNSKDVSAAITEPPASSDMTGESLETATAKQIIVKDEVAFETLPRFVKTVGESGLASQDTLTHFQALPPASEEINIPVTPANLSLPGGAAPLQSSPLIQAQPSLNILTVPIRDVAQNVVQATLKQERTMIRIDPPELGRIQLDFDHSASGKTIVTLSAEIDSVKLMLMERRAFMIGLFEGYGLEDVEIRINNDLDSDAPSSGAQLFSNQDTLSHFTNTSDPSEITSTQADEEDIGVIGNTLSPPQLENSRLHIRV